MSQEGELAAYAATLEETMRESRAVITARCSSRPKSCESRDEEGERPRALARRVCKIKERLLGSQWAIL